MRTVQMTLDEILSKRSTAFQRNSAPAALPSPERHFVTRLPVIVVSNWNVNIVGGMNGTRLLPMSSLFGRVSKLG